MAEAMRWREVSWLYCYDRDSRRDPQVKWCGRLSSIQTAMGGSGLHFSRGRIEPSTYCIYLHSTYVSADLSTASCSVRH